MDRNQLLAHLLINGSYMDQPGPEELDRIRRQKDFFSNMKVIERPNLDRLAIHPDEMFSRPFWQERT